MCIPASYGDAQSKDPWPGNAPEYRVHMIGYGHVDAPWLWPWPESTSVVLSTFRSALDRMKENPDFKFTSSSAQFYEWVAREDPKMLAEIQQRVKEGRWSVVGGWWIEPDVNIPNGESLARQGLYSQRVFQQLFGKIAEVGFNPDSFGHPATLPQILKLEGMPSYVFMRPQSYEKNLPGDLFWWQGPDGSRVMTYRIPVSYNDEGSVEERIHQVVTEHTSLKNLMAFYGVGDHGGGPTKLNLESISTVQGQRGAPKVLYSTPEKYFAEARELPNIPVVEDDLLHHSVGCYTAVSSIKKENRTTEAALATAEKMAALSSVLTDFQYPKAEFDESWKKVLMMQFHDSMAGTALPEHYRVADNAYGYAAEVANQGMMLAAERIAWQVPTTDPQSQYLVVFNPHAWDAKLNVEYDLGFDFENAKENVQTLLEDERGNAIPHQWTQASTMTDHRVRLTFQAPVPAFGYRQFRLHTGERALKDRDTAIASERKLENDHLRVTFNDDGTIALYDKDSGGQVFSGNAGGARAVVIDDKSDTWSHDVRAYTEEIGAFGNASFRILENGPLRAAIRVRSRYGNSELETDWMLLAGARTLEARVTLDWHEHLKMLKFSFPVSVENPQPVYEVPFGFKMRPPNGDEDPGQRWIDVSGVRDGKRYGLSIINDAKYGYSVQDSDLRVSIVRGTVYAHHRPVQLREDGEYLWMDQGQQTFRLLLVPHDASWQDAGTMRMAEEFTAPVPVIYQGIHGGSRAAADSFLSVDVPNVVVSAVKEAEDGNDLIIRCYETAGRTTTATFNLALVNQNWTGTFRPLEIKTLRVPRSGGVIREVNILEQ